MFLMYFRNDVNILILVTISESGIKSGIGIMFVYGTQIGGRRNLIINGSVCKWTPHLMTKDILVIDITYCVWQVEGPTHAQVDVSSGTSVIL